MLLYIYTGLMLIIIIYKGLKSFYCLFQRKNMEKTCQNYIFDLYATLIKIHTNQNMPKLWRQTADIMAYYGPVYTPSGMKKKYRELIQRREESIISFTGTKWPEADVGEVFREMLLDPPGMNLFPGSGDPKNWDEEKMNEWIRSFSYTFRVNSRIVFSLYPDTLETLKTLRKRGKKVFLLSNAQEVFTVPEMKVLGLYDLFDDIFISSVYRIRKPDPQFMDMLLKKHQLLREESVMIGNDMESDIMMAAACGVSGIHVNTDHYSEEDLRRGLLLAEKQAAGSGAVFSSVEHLNEIL